MLLLLVIIIIVIILLKLIYRSPTYIGAVGESRVANQLKKLDSNYYIVLNDVLIKTDNTISQIDHIVISSFGIFVIETKNYNGWIFGNDKSEYWTQVIYGVKTKFRNPIKQNWSHIFALKKVLSNIKRIKYYPIIVFAGNAELKDIKSNVCVTYAEDLYQLILSNSNEPCLRHNDIINIYSILSKNIIDNSRKNKKEHRTQIYNHIYEREIENNTVKCPKCGCDLIKREGRYGPFWGCSRYPNCHYTRKI